MKKKIILSLLSLFPVLLFAQQAPVISLQHVLNLTERNSPQLSANQLEELAADENIAIAQANYYPTLNGEAIDSTGFPGSSSALDIGGLMGSPYRSGLSGGVVAQQTIWDFGQTAAGVNTSKAEAEFSQEDTKVVQDQIKQLALQTYYECSLDRTQQNTWGKLVSISNLITHEVNKFVNTGQRSIVDGYLSQAETDQAQTAQAYFATRSQTAAHRLAILMGVPDDSFSCPPLPVNEVPVKCDPGMENSPLITRAKADTDVAIAKMQQARTNYYPKIVAVGSLGTLQAARLVPRQDYSVGIGVVVPIVNIGTYDQIKRAETQAEAQDQELAAAEQNLAELNANYDETIISSTVQLEYLQKELDLANKAFSVAKERYISFQGNVEDLRDAFTNLVRTETQINQTRATLLQAKGAKVLVNGGDL